MEIAVKHAQTEISLQPKVQRLGWLLGLLVTLAEARGADVSDASFELYAAKLSPYPDEDLREVIERAACSRRADGEKAWPELGSLLEPLQRMQERRAQERQRRREREAEIEFFWGTYLPEQMQHLGRTEAEVLERWPRFRGTKPR